VDEKSRLGVFEKNTHSFSSAFHQALMSSYAVRLRLYFGSLTFVIDYFFLTSAARREGHPCDEH